MSDNLNEKEAEQPVSEEVRTEYENTADFQVPTEEEIPAGMMPQQPTMAEQLGFDPAQVQGAVQNVQAQIPNAVENFQTQAGAFLKGRSVEEEAAWRQEQQAKYAAAGEQLRESKDPVAETIRAGVGGTMDAVDSATQFGELVGDSAKHGMNQLFGKVTSPDQNPWDPNYSHRDIEWLDIPENWKPENQTGLGKFARGMVEFGLLTRWTGAASKVLGASMKAPPVATFTLRSSNTAVQGSRKLQFLNKAQKVFREGAVADLISSSSEAGNIANLAEEHVPWLAPVIMRSLAVREDDDPWTARLKTVTAGGGMNHVFWGVNSFKKGLWKYVDELAAGKSVDEAADAGNAAYTENMRKGLEADEVAATEMAAQDYVNGDGIGRASRRDEYLRRHLTTDDYNRIGDDRQALEALADENGAAKGDIFDPVSQQSTQDVAELRKPTPHVNPEIYNGPERATYTSDKGSALRHIRDLVNKRLSHQNIATESQIRAVARGNQTFREWVSEVLDDLTNEAFKDADNKLNYDRVREVILEQATPMIDMIEDFHSGKPVGNLANNFEKMLKNPTRYRTYAEGPDFTLTTISPTQKGANIIALNALARTVSDIAAGATHIADKVSITRQADMVFDAMKVLFRENKKSGMMWGLDGKYHQAGIRLPQTVIDEVGRNLKVVTEETDQYFNSLHKLTRGERWEELRDLMELHYLSDGHVRSQISMHEFLGGKLWGARMDDVHIKGKARQLIQGTFFNAILGAPRTIRKAVLGTNTVAMLEPFQAYLGTRLPWSTVKDQKQAAVAAAQIDSIGRMWGESWKMAKRNWELGIARKNQDYTGKYELEADMKEWKSLRPHYERNGNVTMVGDIAFPHELATYNIMDTIVDFNNSPWVKYSMNAMGAGDAFARTNIGRQRMAMKAALKAVENNVDLTDIRKVARETEENFREEVFTKNKEGFWIVKEKAASMAGDEAAMTGALQENFSGFEAIARIPGMKVFFPLVRPGFKMLDLVFQHTPAMNLRDKYHDLVRRPKLTGEPVSQRLLDKYGLKANEVDQAVALIEGRIAMGTSLIGMGVIAAASRRMTGTMPHDPKQRKIWKLNNIQPNSFVFGDLENNPIYVPFIDNMLMPEVFAPLMTMTANIFAYQDVLGEKATDEAWEKLRWMSASMIVDQSMLSGIGDLAILMDPNAGGLKKTGYVVSRIARSHFPGAAISATIGDVIDSTQKEANTLWEMIIRRDAFVKSTLPSKYDILSKDRSGKELVYGPENPLLRLYNHISPIPIVPVKNDPIRKLMQEIQFNIPEAIETLDGVELNSVERSELQRLLSIRDPHIKGIHGDLRDHLEYKMIGGGSQFFKESLQAYKDTGRKVTDGYDLKDAHFYGVVADVFRLHKERVRNIMIKDPKFAQLAKRIRVVLQKKQMLKSNTLTPANIKRVEQAERLRTYGTN